MPTLCKCELYTQFPLLGLFLTYSDWLVWCVAVFFAPSPLQNPPTPYQLTSNTYSVCAHFFKHFCHKYLVQTESSNNSESFVCSSAWAALLEYFHGAVSASLMVSPSWISYWWPIYIEESEINTELQLLLPVNWLARWLQDMVNTLGMLKCSFSSNDFK